MAFIRSEINPSVKEFILSSEYTTSAYIHTVLCLGLQIIIYVINSTFGSFYDGASLKKQKNPTLNQTSWYNIHDLSFVFYVLIHDGIV